MKNPRHKFIALGAAALMFAPSVTMAATSVDVSARSYGEVVEMTVDMDTLAGEEGATQIYKAMKARADAACKRDIPRITGKKVRMKKCMKQLVGGFVRDLDDERVTALHKEA